MAQNQWAPFEYINPAEKTIKEFKKEIDEFKLAAQRMVAENGTRVIAKAWFDVEDFIKNAKN